MGSDNKDCSKTTQVHRKKMYNYPRTTTAIPAAQPPVATFVGKHTTGLWKFQNGWNTFHEIPPSLVGLDSSLQENGLEMAISGTLVKINHLHEGLYKNLYKNFPVYHAGIVTVYFFSMIIF